MIKIIQPSKEELPYNEVRYDNNKLYLVVAENAYYFIHKAGRSWNAFDMFDARRTLLSKGTSALSKCVLNCLDIGLEVYAFENIKELMEYYAKKIS